MELKPIALDELQFKQLLETAKRTADATERTANLLQSLNRRYQQPSIEGVYERGCEF